MTARVVDEYLARIEEELQDMDESERSSIILELEGYISERALEMAEDRAIRIPTIEMYQEVIEKLGPPDVIGRQYLDIGPKEHMEVTPPSSKKDEGIQKSIYIVGAIIIVVGLFMTFLQSISTDAYGNVESEHPFVPLSFGVLILGILTISFARWIFPSIQWRRTSGHQKMGFFVGSMILTIGILLTPTRDGSTFPFLVWGLAAMIIGLCVVFFALWIVDDKPS